MTSQFMRRINEHVPLVWGGLRVFLVTSLAIAMFPSCGSEKASPGAASGNENRRTRPSRGIKFKDTVETNAALDSSSLDLTFVDTAGETISIADYRGTKNLVLVITRGFPGYICPYCSTQTSRLISNYEEFKKRDAEVLVVFPGEEKNVNTFLAQSQPKVEVPKMELPFPVLLDVSFAAVDQLGIRGSQAKPSTYILDKKGQVQFAYVGTGPSDRPSIAALLEKLDMLQN